MTNADARPLAETGETIAALVEHGLQRLSAWEAAWPATAPDATVDFDLAQMTAVIDAVTGRLADNYPFFHTDYAAQMLAPEAMEDDRLIDPVQEFRTKLLSQFGPHAQLDLHIRGIK